MKSAPAISCVIPVFNGKRDLKRAVASVLAQRPDVQVVLVDDGSTDGTTEHVMELARGDDRVLTVVLPESRGQGNARNIGVAAATSAYVTFLDQDDEHVPGWYDYAIGVLDANPHYAAIKGGVELAEVPPEFNFLGPADPRMRAITGSAMWNVVVRKIAYQLLGGCPARRQMAEDIAFVAVLRDHFTLVETDYPSTQHYVRPDSSTGYFLGRTRVEGKRFVYLEAVRSEREGTIEKQLAEFQAQADTNVSTLRATLKPDGKADPEAQGNP